MTLPEWAYPPVAGATHGDNYSAVDVVWTHPDGHVTVQRPPEPEPPAGPVDAPLTAIYVDETDVSPAVAADLARDREHAAAHAATIAALEAPPAPAPAAVEIPAPDLTPPVMVPAPRHVEDPHALADTPAQEIRWRLAIGMGALGGSIAACVVVAVHITHW